MKFLLFSDLHHYPGVFMGGTWEDLHEIQRRAPYHGPCGVDLDGSPDFETIAAAYGIPSIVIDNEDTMDEQLDRFLATKGSCLLICQVHPDTTTTD